MNIEIIYGINVIEELLINNSKLFVKIFILNKYLNNRLKTLIKKIEKIGIPIQIININNLDRKFKNVTHQGIIAQIYQKKYVQEKDLPIFIKKCINPLLLILDGVTDPHNLGACLRCADAAGVNAVIIPRNRSVKLNSTVRKVASGAADNIPLICVTNLVRTISLLKTYNIHIIGTDIKKNNCLFKSNLINSALALVMGSENHGLRTLTKKYCNELIYIPMYGIVNSLNVSVATGIFLFEILRQRKIKLNIK